MLLLESNDTLDNRFETRTPSGVHGMANLGIRCVRINPESEEEFGDEQCHLFAEHFSEEWLQVLLHDEE
jgi:hypothetical protein